MDNSALAKIFESGHTDDPLDEIQTIISLLSPNFPQTPLTQLHREIELLFNGEHPDYKESNTRYHNLSHTYSVVLATIRIFHGLICDNRPISMETISKALHSAYFHDCGLLLRSSEEAESGAKFTIGHEHRSVIFMDDFLQSKGFSDTFIADCSLIIHSTSLGINPKTLFFSSKEVKLASFVVSSADILAQMADRYYLERLPFLYQEFIEGGINKHNSPLDLMIQTCDFYSQVVEGRLTHLLGNVASYLQIHFRERWGLDRNLYIENIKKNLNYIKHIVEETRGNEELLDQYLRREPPQ